MKGFYTRTATVALVLCLSVLAWGDSHQPRVEMVAENIYMLTGKGGNIGVMVGKEGTFVIDDQYAPQTPAILKAIESIGGNVPTFVINTHFHGDHTGGNENLGEAGALIMAHDNVHQRLQQGYQIPAFSVAAAPAKPKALPVITFDHQLGLHINGEELRAYFVPNAHTDGDSIIEFKNANVIHAGDTFFNGYYPFIDVTHGGTLKGAIAAADTMLAMVDEHTRIIPGHGPLANKQDLMAYRDMLATAYARLSKLKAAGKSMNEAQAAKPLADLEAQWGGVMFDSNTWISLIYAGLD